MPCPIGKANFMQVGEVADADEEMRRYVGTNVELPEPLRDPGSDPDGTGDYPQLDAVIDFELHRADHSGTAGRNARDGVGGALGKAAEVLPGSRRGGAVLPRVPRKPRPGAAATGTDC